MKVEARPGPYVVLSVADAGAGIPPASLEKIFEPFFTTKEMGEGTGLGLSTVLGIVRSHNGFVDVYSELGKGSHFKVYLPALCEDSPALSNHDLPEPQRGHGELILVVDDEASVRVVTRETLEINGYRVITASDGTEAVALFALHKGEIAVVLTDMLMPFMDGAATIRALLKMDPETIIIAASGLAANRDASGIGSGGARAFLNKPYTAERLLTTLATVLG